MCPETSKSIRAAHTHMLAHTRGSLTRADWVAADGAEG